MTPQCMYIKKKHIQEIAPASHTEGMTITFKNGVQLHVARDCLSMAQMWLDTSDFRDEITHETVCEEWLLI